MVKYTNPILPGFYPDPSVCRVGDTFYLVNSSFAYYPGVPIHESKDLVHWRQIGNILDRPDNLPLYDVHHSGGIYAPTIRYHEGVFYMITTNIGNRGNFVVTASNPAGPWSEPHWLEGADGIDPSLFFDDDGKCYYCGTKGAPDEKYFGDNVIYIRELDLNTFKLVGEEYHAWRGALKNVEWPEGPHIYKKDGWYYVMIAEAGTSIDHAVTIARSRSLSEPFTGCKHNPVLTHRHLGEAFPVSAVGHADLVDDGKGNWYCVCLAMRKCDGVTNTGRETFLCRVTWEDGWPVFNAGEGKLLDCGELPLEEYRYPDGELGGYDASLSIDMQADKLPYKAVTLHTPDEDYCTIGNGCLSLKCGANPIRAEKFVSYVGIRIPSMHYAVKTDMEFCPNGREEAGLVLLQSNFFHIRLVLGCFDGQRELRLINSTREGESVLFAAKVSGSRYCLGFRQDGQKVVFSAEGADIEYCSEPIDTHHLSTEIAGGFVGCTAGMFASSNTGDTEQKANRAKFYAFDMK